MARWLNKQAKIDLMRRLPEAVRQAVQAQLEVETSGMVAAMRRAAPVGDELEDQHPGKFRDSIHSYPTPDRPLSNRIVADAQDDKGVFIGPPIEFGHLAHDGSHVPPKPSFFPTYRARKKPARSRMHAAARRAIKREAGAQAK
jgi:hypothetical protein